MTTDQKVKERLKVTLPLYVVQDLESRCADLLAALRQIDAALNQTATYPADVALARTAARSAIANA